MNYNTKSNDSFNARLRFYLYYCVTRNNSEASLTKFLEFDIDTPEFEKYVIEYTSKYYQYERDKKIKGIKLDTIYSNIKTLELQLKSAISEWKLKYKTDVFENKFPKEDFDKLGDVKACHYCEISVEEIKELRSKHEIFKKNERGYNLELDRKLPNREYSKTNCVMACYWCNNAKTDEFTAEEFAPIGKAIGEALRKRNEK